MLISGVIFYAILFQNEIGGKEKLTCQLVTASKGVIVKSDFEEFQILKKKLTVIMIMTFL